MAFPLQVTISSLSLVSFKYAHECEQLGFGVCLEFLPRSVWQGVAHMGFGCVRYCNLVVHNVVKRELNSQCCLMLG